VVAGGTDLLLDLQQGRHSPVDTLVDVSGIEEMKRVTLEDEQVYVGAAVTHKSILDSALLQQQAACLVDACSLIGGPQVRNVATLGGNVAHALPAADGTIALMALGAEALIASADQQRWVPLDGLFAGPGEVTFNRRRELLVGFRFSRRLAAQTSAFSRVMRPQGVAIAILNAGIWLHMGEGRMVEEVHIAFGPGGPRPFRARQAEEFLAGCFLEESARNQAKQLILDEIKLRTSRHRASEAYRKRLVAVLFDRTLEKALARLDPTL
jgi:carbon-monoxide dehydrogenase medium subunit